MHRIEAYVGLAIIFILMISALYSPILFVLRRKGKSVIRQMSYVGFFCSVFLIIFATILFVPITFRPENYILNINPFDWLENANSMQQFVVEKIPNIILFIPLGFFVPVVFKNNRKFHKIIIISFILTFGVEFFQYFIGRSADIVDVITNLFGAVIGYGIFMMFDKVFKSTKWWNELLSNH